MQSLIRLKVSYKMKITTHSRVISVVLLAILVLTFPAAAKSVPDFSLKQLDGNTYNFSKIVGKKVIIIDFWATWCKPCKKLLKKLNIIHKKYKDDVEILAISTDNASAFSNVESYIKSKGYTFTVLLDPDNNVVRVFNPSRQLPYTLIIDKKGNIAFSHTGYMPGYEKEIIKKIEKLTHEK
jgi:cytochrome c biogenesis protein CcmG, thiol:disulfide interchange protein DsbE